MSITLVTGLPGSGKTLLTVGQLLPDFIAQKFEKDGQPHSRPLKSNINGLLLEHEKIDADDLGKWPEWAKAGDVICFDEVQEVWRPRAMSVKTPEGIAKLETHRHMGVDFVLMTQHPMLLDQNIRRLVDRHIHVRRVGNFGAAVLYEWDHCSNPSMVKSAFSTRPWRYPKAAFLNYKSATVHTKRPRRLPAAGLVVIAALVALAFFGHSAYARLTERFSDKPAQVSEKTGTPGYTTTTETKTIDTPTLPPNAPALEAPYLRKESPDFYEKPAPVIAGCIWTKNHCSCFDQAGSKVPAEIDSCKQQGESKTVMPAMFPEPPVPADPADIEVRAFMKRSAKTTY